MPTPALRRIARWFMRGKLRYRIFQRINRSVRGEGMTTIVGGPLAGCQFCGGDTAGYVLGASEPAVQQALIDFLPRGGVFYDVGANIGFMSLLGSRLVGDQGTVIAFEPLENNREQFARNLDANQCRNYRVIPVALSDACGTDEIVLDHGGGRAGLKGVRHGENTVTVPVATMDSLDDLPAPDVIKIDVEGAESRVLAGMAATLARKPVVVVEVHGEEMAPVVARFSEAGYRTRVLEVEGGMPHVLALPA